MRLLTYYFFILLLTGCGQFDSNKSQVYESKGYFYDTSIIVILPLTENLNQFDKKCKEVMLNREDIKNIDSLLIKCISDYNVNSEKDFERINSQRPELKIEKSNFIIDLKKYKRQYLAVLNPKGEKEVWINCGCDFSGENWKYSIIYVEDGGNCYFNLKINLTKKVFYDLMVNGVA
jgi:hypothetical protein